MKPLLGLFSEYIYFALRVVAGFLFLLHGAQKLFAVFGRDQAVDLVSLLGFAGIIELLGGSLIVLGLFTPWAAFIASGTMASAYFLVHYPRGGWPIENNGELAVLFCFVFLYFCSRDSGPWSLDRVIRTGKGT